jgi:hypothetical protein
VDRLYNQWLSSQQPSPELGGEGLFGSSDQIAWNSGSTKKGLTLGYVTEDACPGIGDDIEHIPCKLLKLRYNATNCRISAP